MLVDAELNMLFLDIPKEENTSEKQTKMLTRKFSKLSNMELHLSCAVAKSYSERTGRDNGFHPSAG